MSACHEHTEEDQSVAASLGRTAPHHHDHPQVERNAVDLIRILTGHQAEAA